MAEQGLMRLHLAGVSHDSCPVDIRERLAASPAAKALERLSPARWAECVVLSTCNRFELYGVIAPGAEASSGDELLAVLEEAAGGLLGERSYRRSGEDCVRHLFSVAAGLDSLVLGETEILGQVKHAYEAARRAGRTGKVTNVLFQRALSVGKQVRTETAVAVGHTSAASVAVDLAERIFGELKRSEVLILGAGRMAELASRHFVSSKIGRLSVANRTYERAVELAARFGAEALRWEEFPGRLETVDIVLSSTGAERPVITRETVSAALPRRRGRSLFLIDIAMPRDVEERVNDLEGVYLYTLEDLRGIVAENLSRRRGELAAARALVRARADEFRDWHRAAAAGAIAPAGRS